MPSIDIAGGGVSCTEAECDAFMLAGLIGLPKTVSVFGNQHLLVASKATLANNIATKPVRKFTTLGTRKNINRNATETGGGERRHPPPTANANNQARKQPSNATTQPPATVRRILSIGSTFYFYIINTYV